MAAGITAWRGETHAHACPNIPDWMVRLAGGFGMREVQLLTRYMNYVSAVYGILAIIIATDWFSRGRRQYRGQDQRHDETAAFVSETAGEKGGDYGQ
ncbi:MAG: hypothetical protein Q9193_001439 [Seirophora villosa]